MAAYYNEFDPYAAQWIRNLIAAGHIAPGDVDERDIRLVRPDDLRGYRQCHFFAGIGVWSHALRLAGFQDEEEVWTGSCPCQPFSDAGKGEAFDDERDLWPEFFGLIRECRPRLVVGEQVASRLGLAWIDAVHADLEGEAYTVGAVDTCAAGFGSPNIRQRLYWMAHTADGDGRRGKRGEEAGTRAHGERRWRPSGGGDADRLGEPGGAGLEGLAGNGDRGDEPGRIDANQARSTSAAGEPRGVANPHVVGRSGDEGAISGIREGALGSEPGRVAGGVGDAEGRGRGERGHEAQARRGGHADGADAHPRPGPLNGFWRAADWLCCTDGRWRPTEPGAQPLAHGVAARMGRLRAYGNAINARQAAHFCVAVRERLGEFR